MDIPAYNRDAWNREVAKGNKWTVPVGSEVIAAARQGDFQIFLTPVIPVPPEWLSGIESKKVLCLASGGGQQAPVLAAAGARVTVLDNSPGQLAQDRLVAEREKLELNTVEGQMADLSAFPDSSFDLIVHPVSNVFTPDVRPVWRECFRVLSPGGSLLAGFSSPIFFLIDWKLADETRQLQIKYPLPYSDARDLPEAELAERKAEGLPMEFGHTLDDQIGGQIEAGFIITGFYEDRYADEDDELLSQYTATFMATRAVKPGKL